jgi:hypothetical protein
MSAMMPQKDPFAQVLCDLAASVEISKQLESALDQLRHAASCGSEHEVTDTHCDFHLIGAHTKPATL